MLELRASSLRQVSVCPGFSRVAAANNTDTTATRSGSLIHAAMEVSFLEGRDAAEAKWPELVQQWSPTAEPPEVLHSLFADYWDWFCRTFPAEVALGKRCEIPLRKVYEFKVKNRRVKVGLNGIADLVCFGEAGTVYLFDHKAYRDPSMLPPIVEDLQQAAYAVLLHHSAPQIFRRVVVRRVLVRQLDYAELTLDEQGLEVAHRTILRVLSEYARRPDELVTGVHCHNCLARHHCPEYPALAAELPDDLVPYRGAGIQSAEQAVWLARALPAADALLDRARVALRQWVQDNGPLVDGGQEYALRPCRVENIQKAALIEIAREHGIDVAVAAVGSISKRSVKDALGSDEAYEAMLGLLRDRDLIGESTAYRMSWGKARP